MNLATEGARPRRSRMSAEDRRPLLIDAAVAEFAAAGLQGATTDAIARRAGISQSYVFRLFPTKLDLFLAAVGRCFDRVQSTFEHAIAETPEGDRLGAMGMAYGELLRDREALLMQLQSYAAAGDPAVRDFVRERYAALYRFVEEGSGASPERVRQFFAVGMLLNLAATLDLPELGAAAGDLMR